MTLNMADDFPVTSTTVILLDKLHLDGCAMVISSSAKDGFACFGLVNSVV